MSAEEVSIRLEPLSLNIAVPRGAPLLSSLSACGIEFPCGGTGQCGGCGIRILAGALAVTEEDRAVFSPEQLAGGWRLACRARATDRLVVECRQWSMDVLWDYEGPSPAREKRGLGVAIDLGTTTIAAQLIDLASGRVLGVETGLNPQCGSGSDVMSRIRAVLDGADLTSPVHTELARMIVRLASDRLSEISEVVLVGNTVMHHLFCGLDLRPLAQTPFVSPSLGTQLLQPRQLGWRLNDDCMVRFLRCLGGFVGSDILAGIVATGMASASELTALIDLGTNGEIALGNREKILCASAAAGPAFEAGTIRMGMRAAAGAISHVSLCRGALEATVIGRVEPRGICGSGLVDAVAAGLECHAILPSGRIANGLKQFPVVGQVALCQADIRELQLAKASIAAGLQLLLRRIGAEVDDLARISLAGAFGNYVRIESALRLGLLAAPRGVVHAAGNTALRGARILLAGDPALPKIQHISLAADPDFEEEFAQNMIFPEDNIGAGVHWAGSG